MGQKGGQTGDYLAVDHLTKRYPPVRKSVTGIRDLLDTLKGGREEISALDDVSFEIKKGEWFGLLGPNGAGKTTFCDILLDVTTPSSARVLFEGVDVNKDHDKTKGKICAMEYWFFNTRVDLKDTLLLAGSEWKLDPGECEERIEWIVDLLDLRSKLDEWPIRLSMGMQIKVYIAATLMSSAELLVFDEPTRFVDIFTRKKLYEHLKEFQKKTRTTIIWTTHNLHEAEETCDRIAVLNNHLVTVTTPRKLVEVMGKSNLEEAFIQLMEGEMQGDHTEDSNSEG